MRKLTAILLCMAMIITLASCSGGASQGASDGSGQQSAGAVSAGAAAQETEEKAPAGEDGGAASGNDTESASAKAPQATSGAAEALEQKYVGLREDELKWEYDTASRTIVISGKGPMKDYGQEVPEWDKYAGEAVKIVIGDEVTAVGAGAFLWFEKVEEVKLGAAVEFIGNVAFCDCIELRTVNFPESLQYVGHSAFENVLLHSDSGFTLPEGLLFVGEEAFYSAFKEGDVNIPASLSVIGTGAFANCYVTAFNVDPANPAYASIDGVLYDKGITTLLNYPALKSDKTFEIPGTVTKIPAEAVEVTNDLEKIVIPASVSSIEESAFFWNYGLKGFEVDAGNTSYKAVDGVLFTADGKVLLSYPLASERTEYTIPAGTERVGDYSMGLANLTELHTEEGLRELGEYSLYSCDKLITVGLPKSLQKIENSAFTYCNALTEVRFAGKSADWQKVEIEEGNDILTNGMATIYCND